MKGSRHFFLCSMLYLAGCAEPLAPTEQKGLGLQGTWITDAQGEVMLDPQTSGLIKWRDRLLTVADGSAHVSQRLKLSQIAPDTSTLYPQSLPMKMSPRVQASCFAKYLSDEPDFEALVVDPQDDRVFIVVTEDATRSGDLSTECADKYRDTGSTEYPTLLVRLELQEDQTLSMTHVRPVQFDPAFGVGDFPNDGIEGMAYSPQKVLYLGLEKDANGQPRIFSLNIGEEFWNSDEFAPAMDPQLATPTFESGNHPINGMDFYPTSNGGGFIIAAARNDEEIWIIDTEKKHPTKVIPVHFYAQVLPASDACPEWELMHNASLEGVAVDGDTLWLINDPWKRHYDKNIQCESNRGNYDRMAPLLFKMDIESDWFAGH